MKTKQKKNHKKTAHWRFFVWATINKITNKPLVMQMGRHGDLAHDGIKFFSVVVLCHLKNIRQGIHAYINFEPDPGIRYQRHNFLSDVVK